MYRVCIIFNYITILYVVIYYSQTSNYVVKDNNLKD
jgi:hypothetical protein